jgi:AsmA protein
MKLSIEGSTLEDAVKRILLILGALVVLLLVGVVAATFLIDPNHFRPMLEAELTSALGREVKLGDLKLSILSGSVTANDLAIADDAAYSRKPFVQAKSLAIGVEVWPLVASRQLHVTGLTIEQPAINLIQNAEGDWNFSKMGGEHAAKAKPAAPAAANSSMDLSVKLVKITGGHFSVDRTGGHGRPLVLDDVNVEVRDFSAASAFPFTFATKVAGGGTIKLDGKAGPIDAVDVSATPVSANLNVDKLDLAGTGITQSAPAIAGLIGFQSTLESNGKVAQVTGKLKAESLKLAKDGKPAGRPVEFDFKVDHNLRKRSGQLHKGEIRIGSAPASLAGTYAQHGESMSIQMNLDGPKMPVAELYAMLPAMGIVLPRGSSLEGGTASVKLAMQGALETLVTSGTLSLDNTKLAGFDMGKKMATIEKFAGMKGGPDTEIQTLGASMRISPEGITADKVELILPAIGNLEGSGTSTPEHVLDFKMRATVHTSGLLAPVGGVPIPFTVEGPATDPIFRPDMKGLAKEELGSAVGKASGLLKGLLGGKKQ